MTLTLFEVVTYLLLQSLRRGHHRIAPSVSGHFHEVVGLTQFGSLTELNLADLFQRIQSLAHLLETLRQLLHLRTDLLQEVDQVRASLFKVVVSVLVILQAILKLIKENLKVDVLTLLNGLFSEFQVLNINFFLDWHYLIY